MPNNAEHATRDELNLAYVNFNRAIDKLSDVLNEHSRKQEKMNDRIEERIKELERDGKLSKIEFNQRISKLEEDKMTREAQKGLVTSVVKLFPKTFLILLFLVGAGVVKISDEVTVQKSLEANTTHAVTRHQRSASTVATFS